MHASLWTFMRDETGVASAIAVRHRAAERCTDLPTLFLVEPLGSNEYDTDAQIVHTISPCFRTAGDARKSGRIAKKHFWPNCTDFIQKPVNSLVRHLKGRE